MGLSLQKSAVALAVLLLFGAGTWGTTTVEATTPLEMAIARSASVAESSKQSTTTAKVALPSTGALGVTQVTAVEYAPDEGFSVAWRAASGKVTSYVVETGPSRYAREDLWQVAAVVEDADARDVTVPTSEAYNPGDPYQCYFRVRAEGKNGKKTVQGDPSDAMGIEMALFGDHTYVFAETDDTATIDRMVEELFVRQNDKKADAQFRAEHYQVYFKPGDYTQCACMNVGYYTALGGLGKLPTDTRLNNIAVPPYLEKNRATCNFWRSAENLCVCDTGNEQGMAGYGSIRPDQLNWAVAQAAPLRRIYSERAVAYDWNYGWASGGFLADSRIVGSFDDNGTYLSAGTYSGQQFYTRNTQVAGDVYGTTLNGVYQGVIAPNLPNADSGTELYGGRGYSNWSNPGREADNGVDFEQQCVTSVTTTDVIREKPFLYLENGEYRVFVPSLRTDVVGPSWDDNDMGRGVSLSLTEDFYVASPDDSAALINRRLAEGRNVYFTPGTYYVEQPILVNRSCAVLLGSGLASIVPINGGAAMKVGDVEGVTVAGLIFDAGPEYSECLLQVGSDRSRSEKAGDAARTDGSDPRDPTLLADLFFRIGGVSGDATDVRTAMEINSNHVIGDHFWMWRADHGSGVGWHENVAQHGLVVNGDDVTVYGLFNEHFQGYATLWNGERGSMYFYQNETAYDPVTQAEGDADAWLSHNGSVYGYASYKVANTVRSHYAVGMGVYNVFINTGGGSLSTSEYDGGAQIKLENAVEVPNSADVVIENACMQSFANSGEEGGLYQETQHIINDVGYGVSQGYLRTERRDESGALTGNLLDADGYELPTEVMCTSKTNKRGQTHFSYRVYELDGSGLPIVYDNGEELDLDALPDDVGWEITDEGFVMYTAQGDISPDEYRAICGVRPASAERSRAVKGKGWARTFLTRYHDGVATFGMEQYTPALYNHYVGLETREGVRQLGDDIDYADLEAQYERATVAARARAGTYTAASFAGLSASLGLAESYMDSEDASYVQTRKFATQEEVDDLATELEQAVNALETEKDRSSSSSGREESGSAKRQSVSRAHVSHIPVQPWTGEDVLPEPAVRLGGKALELGKDYALAYENNVDAGIATVTVKGKGAYKGSKKVTFAIVKPSVWYVSHVQGLGPLAWQVDGAVSGTLGESRRLEAIKVRLGEQPVAGSIRYRSHVQSFGWEESWTTDGEASGCRGKSKRLEAVQIELTGEMAAHYDVCYRVQAEQLGWMPWVRNGATAGTEGIGLRLEAIQIVVVPKGDAIPSQYY